MGLLLNLFLISQGVPFLSIYPGAGPTGMAGAYCAIAEGAYANFYNPSGLAFQKGLDLSFDYNSIPLGYGIRYWDFTNSLELNKNISLGLFGSGVIYPETKVVNEYGDYVGAFNSHEFTTGLSFGYKVNKFLGAGISLKYIHSFYSPEWALAFLSGIGPFVGGTGRSLAIDIGFLAKYSLSFGKVGVGFAVQQVGPNINYSFNPSGEKFSLPLNIRAGISYSISAQEVIKDIGKGWFMEWLKEKARLIITYDINKIREEKLGYSFGIEFRPVPFLAARCGYFNVPGVYGWEGSKGWTKGLGVDFKFLRLDISDTSPLYYTHQLWFSLSLNIGEPIFPKNGLFGKQLFSD
jgi:hypothetical protein